MSSTATRYVRSPDVLWRQTAAAVLTRHVDGGVITLTGTGPALWDLLDQPRTVKELASALADRFGAPVSMVTSDVEATLGALRGDRIVQAIL